MHPFLGGLREDPVGPDLSGDDVLLPRAEPRQPYRSRCAFRRKRRGHSV
jgi:hypothetical protein